MPGSVYSRTLRKAAELLGGRKELCSELKIAPAELEEWIADKRKPPQAVFLGAVEILLQETPVPDGSGSTDDPPAPRDCAPGRGSFTVY